MSNQNQDDRHKARMQRKKAVVDSNIAAAHLQRGLFLIHTGNGKGKSTAAFGLLARALGHGMKAAVVQFIKSRSDTGEESFFKTSPSVTWHVMGDGFTWETQDAEQDKKTAQSAWAIVKQALQDASIDIIILDEFTYTLKYGWLEIDEVISAIQDRPVMQHLVVTGRGAPPALVEIADTVSEIALVKHAFHAGVQAMPGIEF
ncbi:MAG: cob(I)yrinic acid a,c-diamide adenosyltransferase [Methylophilus sp.]